jgi:putative peptidoglycan lipid II flippase
VAEERAREARSAAAVQVAIALSRLVGLVRNRITAYYFGTDAVADAIGAAFRIGNLAQNLLGEGTLSATFIPAYARLRAEGKHDEARAFARSSLGALCAVVAAITAVGVAAAPVFAFLVGAGFTGDKRALTVELVRWLFPMTGLLVLCAWALGVLNAHRSFFLPYVSPVVWSAGQIVALAVGGRLLFLRDEALARALAIGAIAGAAANLLLLLWRAGRHVGVVPSFDFRDPTLREAAGRFPSVLLGRGVIQISGLIDTLLVSFLGSGATAAFTYAQTLYLLPMSLLGTGEAAVSLPEMAGDSALEMSARNARFRERLGTSLTRVVVLTVPAVLVMSVLSEELVALLLRTGRFDHDSTLRVAGALRVYGLALLGNASVRLFATAFFALGQTRLPARMAVVIASTLGSLALMRPFGLVGVVTGAMIAAWVEALLLGAALRREIGGLGLERLPVARLAALALACGGPPLAMKLWLGVRASEPLYASGVLTLAGLMFLVTAPALKLFNVRAFLRRK